MELTIAAWSRQNNDVAEHNDGPEFACVSDCTDPNSEIT